MWTGSNSGKGPKTCYCEEGNQTYDPIKFVEFFQVSVTWTLCHGVTSVDN